MNNKSFYLFILSKSRVFFFSFWSLFNLESRIFKNVSLKPEFCICIHSFANLTIQVFNLSFSDLDSLFSACNLSFTSSCTRFLSNALQQEYLLPSACPQTFDRYTAWTNLYQLTHSENSLPIRKEAQSFLSTDWLTTCSQERGEATRGNTWF